MMPDPQDPSFWQVIADSRLVQALVTAFGIAIAMGAALRGYMSRNPARTKEDRDLKAELESGLPTHVIKEVAHELHGLREDLGSLRDTVGDLRERVSSIEGFIRGKNGVK